jgi:hypothetical protein
VQQIFVRTEFCEPGDETTPAAIGFEAEVDAISFRFQLPSPAELETRAQTAPSLRSWRTAFLSDLIQADTDLPTGVNTFLRDWLRQIYVSALVSVADAAGITLAEANEQLRTDSRDAFGAVMDGIFHIRVADGDMTSEDRLRGQLEELLADASIVRRLAEYAVVLWTDAPSGWDEWLHRALHETLGQCAALACLEVAPQQVAEDSLVLDLVRGIPGQEPTTEAWLTETSIGGAGSVQAIARVYAGDPRRMLKALEAAFAESDAELVSEGFRSVTRLAVHDAEVKAAIANLRATHGPVERDTSLRELSRILTNRAIFMDHSLSVALNQRLLREGSQPSHDELLVELIEHWESLEQRFGIAIDLRVFCYLAAQSATLGPRIAAMISGGAGQTAVGVEAVGVLSGLLMPLPSEARQHALQHRSPYRNNGFIDPALIRELLFADADVSVHLNEYGWEERFRLALAEHGRVSLVAPPAAMSDLQLAVASLIATPIDQGYLQFHPSVDRIRFAGEALTATFVMRTFS